MDDMRQHMPERAANMLGVRVKKSITRYTKRHGI